MTEMDLIRANVTAQWEDVIEAQKSAKASNDQEALTQANLDAIEVLEQMSEYNDMVEEDIEDYKSAAYEASTDETSGVNLEIVERFIQFSKV